MQPMAAWTGEYSPDDSLEILRSLALPHARKGGSKGVGIAKLLMDRDFSSLARYELTYEVTDSPSELYHCRQALALISKCEFLDIGIDKEAVAYAKFLEAESACRLTNQALRKWSTGDFNFPRGVDAYFHAAAQRIARVLGPVPKLEELKFRFGPGATTTTKKRHASIREKLRVGVTCSEELEPIVSDILYELPVWSSHLGDDPLMLEPSVSVPVRVTTGRLTFVPKNAKTYRAVVTEPSLNGMVQLGIGDFITARLAAFGLNLRDQSRNQRLAREGSLTGALATLDLSSASDTISTELVYHLLPLDWAVLLNRFRSRKVDYKGSVITQEKFSSMGNGFTFPLESLIFWALTLAVCPDTSRVSVYGDDIICPTDCCDDVRLVLRCAGFTVNMEKSYWSGPFRESCGADFFRGFDIRPAYHKKLVSPATLFVLHNYYVRTCQTDEALFVLGLIHPSLRLFGPDGYGDGHLLGDWHPRPHKRKIGWSGYIFDTFTLKSRRDLKPVHPGDCVVPMYAIYMRGEEPLVRLYNAPLEDSHRRMGYLSRVHGALKSSTPWANSLPGADGYKRVSIYTLTP